MSTRHCAGCEDPSRYAADGCPGLPPSPVETGPLKGCGDSGCVVETTRARGLQTNGGCCCPERVLRRAVMYWRQTAREASAPSPVRIEVEDSDKSSSLVVNGRLIASWYHSLELADLAANVLRQALSAPALDDSAELSRLRAENARLRAENDAQLAPLSEHEWSQVRAMACGFPYPTVGLTEQEDSDVRAGLESWRTDPNGRLVLRRILDAFARLDSSADDRRVIATDLRYRLHARSNDCSGGHDGSPDDPHTKECALGVALSAPALTAAEEKVLATAHESNRLYDEAHTAALTPGGESTVRLASEAWELHRESVLAMARTPREARSGGSYRFVSDAEARVIETGLTVVKVSQCEPVLSSHREAGVPVREWTAALDAHESALSALSALAEERAKAGKA